VKRFVLTAVAIVCSATMLAAQQADTKPAAGPAKTAAKPAAKPAAAAKADANDQMAPGTFAGFEMRNIGPALTSGRIIDIAVEPGKPHVYYVATVGGVWKTTTNGTSWTPVFDGEGSFSIGCITIDPNDPLVVWVGTGENNSQRSVSYGDGVYKSLDGGRTWTNAGLKTSMHIGRIAVDPRDSKVVYVAAMGNLWEPGGERGLYRTTDGGKTWTAALTISENTGVVDVAMDPRNPDVLYASAYQRRRHVWTLINGGPESAIHKSTDAGKTWTKITNGLPTEDLGRIGLGLAPSQPDTLYAIVEAANRTGGFFRSTNRGASWEKMSNYVSAGPMYYNEIVVDPTNADRVYSLDTYLLVSDDAGRTFRNAGERWKHIDNHALWINPQNPDHLINGNDGGVYESHDRAKSWAFKANLPVTQFYRVDVDNSKPFYFVYGGTQDNMSLGGPSRTLTQNGIPNDQWFVTSIGDGFVTRIDPEDPNIVYAEAQHGALVRYDRRTGEMTDIQPQAGKGEPALRWNWDSPLIISPHAPARLYFAANRLFRSDDRGNSWKPVSGDLTRQIDRNTLKVMGRVWSPEAVAKNSSTSFYGNIVSLAESPAKEGLIYVGTDDGLVQVTEDGGTTWRKAETFPGVSERSYVSRLEPSPRDANVVYAAFNNHKMGDLKPYVLKSSDRGKTWTSITGNLPARGSVHVVIEDPVKTDLLFAGTEFGLFFSIDGGKAWVQMTGGMPVIAIRDLVIQKREVDLVAASFGRGFFILDDFTPLRHVTPQVLESPATLFPLRQAYQFLPSTPYALRGKAFFGESFYTAPNPPHGAVFTYYLKDGLKTKRQARLTADKKTAKEGGDTAYPTWDALRAEDREEAPSAVLTVTDEAGNVVRRITGPSGACFHRVAWDLRYPATSPMDPTAAIDPDNLWSSLPTGPMAAPGTYKVSLALWSDGKETVVGQSEVFQVVPVTNTAMTAQARAESLAFQQSVGRLQRAVLGSVEAARAARQQLSLARAAIFDTPKADAALLDNVRALDRRLRDIQVALNGDTVVARHNEPVPPSIVGRVETVVGGLLATTVPATGTQRENYRNAAEAFGPVLEQLRAIVEVEMKALGEKLEAVGAPWTPGRVPRWKPE
jgi:photosystem II stability/assembly factor-like uncharacterized protein